MARFPLRKMAAGQSAHKENRPDKTTSPVKHICYNGAAGRAEAPGPVTTRFLAFIYCPRLNTGEVCFHRLK